MKFVTMIMTVEFKVNNYTLGACVKQTPVDLIIKQERTDSRHTVIQYSNITVKGLERLEKTLKYKGTIIDKQMVRTDSIASYASHFTDEEMQNRVVVY